MLEFVIYLVAAVLAYAAVGRLMTRHRAAQEQGLAPDDIRRKRALERMADRIDL